MVIKEARFNNTFPLGQFYVQRFSLPCKFDRNRNGGGVMI